MVNDIDSAGGAEWITLLTTEVLRQFAEWAPPPSLWDSLSLPPSRFSGKRENA